MFKRLLSQSAMPSIYLVVGFLFLFSVLFVVMPDNENIKNGQLVRYILFFVALVCLPAVIIDRFYITQRLQTIEYVSSAAKELAAGNLKRRISHGVDDEFSKMIDSFNSMAEYFEQTVKEISELRVLYETLLENSVNGIIVTAPDGTMIYVNPAAMGLLGIHKADIGHNYVNAIQEYEIIQSIDYACVKDQAIRKKLTMHVLGGKIIHLTALPLKTADSRLIGVLAILNDVIEQ